MKIEQVLEKNVLRWTNIPRHERICVPCNLHEIGDEFHEILICNSLQKVRIQCLIKKKLKIKNASSFSLLFIYFVIE